MVADKKKSSKEIVAALKDAHERIDAIATVDLDDKTKKECIEQVSFLINYIFGKVILDKERSDETASFKLPKGIM